ncbi:MAG: FG-GAP-like repeat-containing protein [Planctomycetia bacterium]|nr:FG-GAP-like repeat-containing protein [Planctomycetia bacterium]
MKDSFFHRVFAKKYAKSLPETRRLRVESLEHREMLNVDWGGFGAETISTFETTTDAQTYGVDFENSVDLCKLTDLTGDGRNELLTFNFSAKTVSVYANTATDGNFTLKTTQTLDSLGPMVNYTSVICKDNELLIVSTSDGLELVATSYKWNSTTSSLVQNSQTSLDTSNYNPSNDSLCVFTSISATLYGDSNLIVQASTVTSTSSYTRTVNYSGYGSSNFGKSARTVTTITESLMGSTQINGTNYLILKELGATTNSLVLANIDTTTQKYSYSLEPYGQTVTFNWVVEQDGFLVLGAQSHGASALITVKCTTPVDGADITQLGEWFDCDDIKFDAKSSAAIGDIGGDSSPELIIANGNEHKFYVGASSSSYQYTFTSDGVVVSSPDLRSVYIGDVSNNGKTTALLVGNTRVYSADVDDSGAASNLSLLYTFTQPVKKAVFGDFNGDGRVDFAVQYQANVGASLQVFQQLSDGSYVALATQSFNGYIQDIGVGKFSQTSVDEIAVMTTRYNSTVVTTVNTLMLSGAGSSTLTATRTYVGSTLSGSYMTVGSVYGSSVDDIVTVNTSQDTITILRNTGSSLSPTTITTAYDSSQVANPVSVAIGDFNGDGLADIAALNSSSGTNYANVVYYLRSESGFGTKPSGRTSLVGSVSVDHLSAVDLNSDGLVDLTLVRQGTDGVGYVSALMANGASDVFDSAINTTISFDPSTTFGTNFARVDGDNISYDYVWVQDKYLGVLLNRDSTDASGAVRFLCQSLSQSAGASYSAASSTARTWLDEWSNFYIDVWVSTNGGGAATNVVSSFNYNGSYFQLADVESATGYSVSYTDNNGVVTATATGSGSADSDGWTLVARMRFEPISGGVALPDDGVLTSVNPGFSASASAQSINGSIVETASAPTNIKLYPFVFDVDRNGTINTNDLGYFLTYFGNDVSEITNRYYRILDYDLNGTINTNDLGYFLQAFGVAYTDGLDSIYLAEPNVSSSSSVLESAFSLLTLEKDSAFVPATVESESVVAAVASNQAKAQTVATGGNSRLTRIDQAFQRFHSVSDDAEADQVDDVIDLTINLN